MFHFTLGEQFVVGNFVDKEVSMIFGPKIKEVTTEHGN
jgi:hypothetical protein